MTARRKPTSNVAGLDATLAAMRSRLGEPHAALVALARGLAAAVDDDPANAALWREYRATLATLSEVGADVEDDDTAAFLGRIRTPALRSALGHSA